MNYLAHIYLSGDDRLLRVGNFIADAVRGKNYLNNYPKRIAQGVTLHRKIDVFTDTHETVRHSKKLIRGEYGHWSGVIVDMYYDHFLAANWSDYHEQSLTHYAQEFYNDLNRYHNLLPEKVQKFLPHMIAQDWLCSYATVEGIAMIFHQMNRRTKNKSNMHFAPLELVHYYQEIARDFRLFFNDLQQFVAQERSQLTEE